MMAKKKPMKIGSVIIYMVNGYKNKSFDTSTKLHFIFFSFFLHFKNLIFFVWYSREVTISHESCADEIYRLITSRVQHFAQEGHDKNIGLRLLFKNGFVNRGDVTFSSERLLLQSND